MGKHYRYNVWIECEREDLETGKFVDGACLGLLPDCLGRFRTRREMVDLVAEVCCTCSREPMMSDAVKESDARGD